VHRANQGVTAHGLGDNGSEWQLTLPPPHIEHGHWGAAGQEFDQLWPTYFMGQSCQQNI